MVQSVRLEDRMMIVYGVVCIRRIETLNETHTALSEPVGTNCLALKFQRIKRHGCLCFAWMFDVNVF
jgi:hypothetical protein